jgi:hypothetical protein
MTSSKPLSQHCSGDLMRRSVHLFELDPSGQLNQACGRLEVPVFILHGNLYLLRSEVDAQSRPGLGIFANSGMWGKFAIRVLSGEVVVVNRDGREQIASPNCVEFAYLAERVNRWCKEVKGPLSEQARELRRQLHDEGILSFEDPDGFWSTLLDDIEIGDFDEE